MLTYTIPLIGGLLIGASAVALLLFLGRIAGVSGIVWGAVSAQPDNSWRWLFVIGGLLVGFGVTLGSGCTSGHGVCGIGRLSPRSIIATLTFMTSGIATVYVVRHVLGGL
jgi:uncharacterized protein